MPRLLGRLGIGADPAVMEAVFTRWDELVGVELGGHVRPLRVDGRALVVAVEHPAWATRARMESASDPGPAAGSWGRPPSSAWRSSSSAPEPTHQCVSQATVQKCRIGAAVG